MSSAGRPSRPPPKYSRSSPASSCDSIVERPQALAERVERRVDTRDAPPAPRPPPPAAGVAPAVSPVSGVERLRSCAGGCAQRVEPAQPLARGQQLLVLGLIRVQRVDLAELVLEQVELALALGGELGELDQPPLELARMSVGGGAGSQARGLLGAAEVVEDLQLGAAEASACGARAGRRRRAASPPRSRSSETVAERPLR